MIQLWHYWEIACSITINKIVFHCYKKHLKWGDEVMKEVSLIIKCSMHYFIKAQILNLTPPPARQKTWFEFVQWNVRENVLMQKDSIRWKSVIESRCSQQNGKLTSNSYDTISNGLFPYSILWRETRREGLCEAEKLSLNGFTKYYTTLENFAMWTITIYYTSHGVNVINKF